MLLPLDQDHPRLRGEHGQRSYYNIPCAGSPPPTRGTRRYLLLRFGHAGITPAYAGNTRVLVSIAARAEDHPRLRGEHGIWDHDASYEKGSPPPTRGTPFLHLL